MGVGLQMMPDDWTEMNAMKSEMIEFHRFGRDFGGSDAETVCCVDYEVSAQYHNSLKKTWCSQAMSSSPSIRVVRICVAEHDTLHQ